MRWFESKSHLCRELEVKAIQEFLDKGETEEERKARMEEDAAWMDTLRVEKLLLFDPNDEEKEDKDGHENEKVGLSLAPSISGFQTSTPSPGLVFCV